LDNPIITFSPTFASQCPRALKVLITATVVGLLGELLGGGRRVPGERGTAATNLVVATGDPLVGGGPVHRTGHHGPLPLGGD